MARETWRSIRQYEVQGEVREELWGWRSTCRRGYFLRQHEVLFAWLATVRS